MAVTKTTLRTAHPEWSNAPDDVVDAMIARAETLLDETVLGDLYDEAVTLKACDELARHPHSRDMRLQAKDDTTVYGRSLRRLIMARGTAYRVFT